jgi:malate permease and related proteins
MLFQLFVNNILPSFIAIGLGVILGRCMEMDLRPISRMALYILTPCLVFSSLIKSQVSGNDMTRVILFLLLVTAGIGLLSWLVARALGLSEVRENALLLSTMFSNAGNMGLSVLLFAFGQGGMDAGLVFYVGSALLNHTLAAYLASRGKNSVGRSVLNMLKLPALYAAIAALILRDLNFMTPDFISKPVALVGNAAVPVLLLLLGMQLARTRIRGDLTLISIATFIKLVVTAALSIGLAAAMGMEGLTRAVCVTEASMPSAVTTIMMSIEFEADPDFVTSVVFLSTLLSSITLTLTFAVLR